MPRRHTTNTFPAKGIPLVVGKGGTSRDSWQTVKVQLHSTDMLPSGQDRHIAFTADINSNMQAA